jgi:hypothetical protein
VRKGLWGGLRELSGQVRELSGGLEVGEERRTLREVPGQPAVDRHEAVGGLQEGHPADEYRRASGAQRDCSSDCGRATACFRAAWIVSCR